MTQRQNSSAHSLRCWLVRMLTNTLTDDVDAGFGSSSATRALDHAIRLEFLHPAPTRRGGNPRTLRQFGHRHCAVALQPVQDTPINVVQEQCSFQDSSPFRAIGFACDQGNLDSRAKRKSLLAACRVGSWLTIKMQEASPCPCRSRDHPSDVGEILWRAFWGRDELFRRHDRRGAWPARSMPCCLSCSPPPARKRSGGCMTAWSPIAPLRRMPGSRLAAGN